MIDNRSMCLSFQGYYTAFFGLVQTMRTGAWFHVV